MIDIHTVPCDHADKPHRVFVGRDIGKTRAFDDQAEAVAHAETIRCHPENIWLIKVYVSDDDYDAHTCWQWRPIEPAVQPDETVRIEKDHRSRLVTPQQFMTAVGKGSRSHLPTAAGARHRRRVRVRRVHGLGVDAEWLSTGRRSPTAPISA
jgi:hypothetical protein